MLVNRRRLLELAASELEAERKKIDAELADIRNELKSESPPSTKGAKKASHKRRKRPHLSAEERRARSERMKKYWADRKKKEKDGK